MPCVADFSFINMIKSSIQNARDVAGGTEILTRCPYCGDSMNQRNAHFYISVPSNPDEVSFYDCKKCSAKGMLNDEVLRKLGCQDSNTIIQVETHNSRVLPKQIKNFFQVRLFCFTDLLVSSNHHCIT